MIRIILIERLNAKVVKYLVYHVSFPSLELKCGEATLKADYQIWIKSWLKGNDEEDRRYRESSSPIEFKLGKELEFW